MRAVFNISSESASFELDDSVDVVGLVAGVGGGRGFVGRRVGLFSAFLQFLVDD